TTQLKAKVSSSQWKGGEVRFAIPWPLPPERPALPARVAATMRALPSLTLTEQVTSGPGSRTAPATYSLSGRQFMQSEVFGGGAGAVAGAASNGAGSRRRRLGRPRARLSRPQLNRRERREGNRLRQRLLPGNGARGEQAIDGDAQHRWRGTFDVDRQLLAANTLAATERREAPCTSHTRLPPAAHPGHARTARVESGQLRQYDLPGGRAESARLPDQGRLGRDHHRQPALGPRRRRQVEA